MKKKSVPNRVKRLLTPEEKGLSLTFTRAVSARRHAEVKDFLDKEFPQFLPRQKESILRVAFLSARMNGDEETIGLLKEANDKYQIGLKVT